MSHVAHLANGHIEVDVETSMGPRIIRLSRPGQESVLASTPDIELPTPDGRRFRLIGGHRLWAAPEVPATTYVPDDTAVIVDDMPSGIRCTQPAPHETGIEKTVEIALESTAPVVAVTHRLRNTGAAPVSVAPWAITMLRSGGRAILPITRRPTDTDEFQADRSIVMWPYTRVDDPLLELHDDHIRVAARRATPTKIGTALRRGWIAYVLDDVVFVKRSTHQDGAVYADLGASGQVYCNERFCELETLGPLVRLDPGQATHHTERWELRDRSGLPDDFDEFAEIVDRAIG